MRIAIVGSGISGSLVARLLHSQHDVTLYEAADYVGGHANTVRVEIGGKSVFVDTGFMVFNRVTYPSFCRLLEMLEVESQPSDMSFSVSCDRTGLEYQGSSLNGLFAQRSNLIRPSFYRLLSDILRFNRVGTKAFEQNSLLAHESVGGFLERHGFGAWLVSHYLVPMTAAIWSGRPESIMDFPAHFLLGFFHNHGLMRILDRPKWRTIMGGSQTYVARLLAPLKDRILLDSPVESIRRTGRGVEVVNAHGVERFDQVVLATHADQSLQLLSDPSEAESDILSKFPYQQNNAILHTDLHQLPSRRQAWASWNYRVASSHLPNATVTYDLNRLQRLGLESPLLLTLNPVQSPCEQKVIRRFQYHHPCYSCDSVIAQKQHAVISGLKQRTHYCGAYWGYGFHEDGVRSAVTVANHFGIDLESCKVAFTKAPSRTVVSCQ